MTPIFGIRKSVVLIERLQTTDAVTSFLQSAKAEVLQCWLLHTSIECTMHWIWEQVGAAGAARSSEEQQK